MMVLCLTAGAGLICMIPGDSGNGTHKSEMNGSFQRIHSLNLTLDMRVRSADAFELQAK